MRLTWILPVLVFFLLILVSFAPYQADAALPTVQNGSLFFRDLETYPTGPVDPTDEHMQLAPNSGHDADPNEIFMNISTNRAHAGTKSLEIGDIGGDTADDIVAQMNLSVPAVIPDYAVEAWFNRDSAHTSGATVFRLLGNLTTKPAVQLLNNIAIQITTGDNAAGACPTNSICFFNTTASAYEQADTLAYNTWYNVTYDVYFNATDNVTYWDSYLNGTLEQSRLPLFDTGSGERGHLHAFVFQGDGGLNRRSRIYWDDLCVKGSIAEACSSTFSVPQITLTPEDSRADFVESRYIQSMTGLTHFNHNDTADWSVRKSKVLPAGCSTCQDEFSAAQGTIFFEAGTYYLFYSMRNSAVPTQVRAIGLATSTDGENFVKTTANGGGDATGVVHWNNSVPGKLNDWHAYAPSYVTKIGSTYYMIYIGTGEIDGSGARYLSFLATSTNLTWWDDFPSEAAAEPLINKTSGHDCFGDAGFESVVLDPATSVYRAVVRCKLTEPSGIRTIHLATSTDLITWDMEDANSDGRVFIESNRHDASVWLHDGLWYMLTSRGMRTVAPQDNRWEFALSQDGIRWQTAKWQYLRIQDMVPLGSSFNASNSPGSQHFAGIFYQGETMRLYLSGITENGANSFEGMWFDIWERTINRWRGVELLPGQTTGTLSTQLITLTNRMTQVNLNIINEPGTSVTVEIRDSSGATLIAESDPVTGSGSSVTATFAGSSTILVPAQDVQFVLRFTGTSTPQVFDVSWSEQIECGAAPTALPSIPAEDPGVTYNRGHQGISALIPSGTLVWDDTNQSNAHISRTGIYASLDMETRVGAQLADLSGRGNNPLIVGATPVQGLFGGARCFTGGSLDFQDQANFDLFTLTAWVRVASTTVADHQIISNGDWEVGYNNVTYYARITVLGVEYETTAANLTVTQYQGLGASFDGITLTLVVDGFINETRHFTTPQTIDFGAQNLTVGASPDGTETHIGDVDELAVWLEPRPTNDLFWATQRPSQIIVGEPAVSPVVSEIWQGLIVWGVVAGVVLWLGLIVWDAIGELGGAFRR